MPLTFTKLRRLGSLPSTPGERGLAGCEVGGGRSGAVIFAHAAGSMTTYETQNLGCGTV